MSIKDLLIVEIAEGVAGPCCGLQYADLGARVIKIETSVGDRTREWGPPMAGDDAAIFAHLNRGKESVVLDLTQDGDRDKLDAILARADAVVAQNDPGEENLPDWRAIANAHPQLVVCEIDDLGPVGPLGGFPGSELTVQAMSGFTRYVGEPGGAPCRVGFEIAGMAAAMNAYQAIAAGIWHRAARRQRAVCPGQRAQLAALDEDHPADRAGRRRRRMEGFPSQRPALAGRHRLADQGRPGDVRFPRRPVRRLGGVLREDGPRPPQGPSRLQGLAHDRAHR